MIPTIKVLYLSSNLKVVIKGLPNFPYKVIENISNAHRKRRRIKIIMYADRQISLYIKLM